VFLTQIDEVVSRIFIVSLELCCLGDFTKCNNFSFVQLQQLIDCEKHCELSNSVQTAADFSHFIATCATDD